MAATLSVWNIPPESAKRIGHPAPFPVDLALRVIPLYSYKDDVVLDPFVGSGTTCVAAKTCQRHYVGYDTDKAYCNLAYNRLSEKVQRSFLSDQPITSRSVEEPPQKPISY